MELRLQTIDQMDDGIATFVFAPAASFIWQAGQSVRLEIAGPYGPLEHRFSISSAPSSGQLAITTRRSDSDYKSSLFAMRPGDKAYAYGLEGDFIWQDTTTPHLFIAGGVGVTPFYAMLAERVAAGLPLSATLIHVNRTETAPFRAQLATWANVHPEFAVHYKIGQRPTLAEIAVIAPSAAERLVYLSGPDAMVRQLCQMLLAAGYNDARILRDNFTGNLPDDLF